MIEKGKDEKIRYELLDDNPVDVVLLGGIRGISKMVECRREFQNRKCRDSLQLMHMKSEE